MKKTRFAFVGFRHSHILDLLEGVRGHQFTELAGCCEEDPATRAALKAEGRVSITHESFETLLQELPCDVVAIGDYYAKRGELVKTALRAGKHVLSDKPLCTTLEQQAEIERLASEQGLLVGLQLDCRGYGAWRSLRELVRSGRIGEVCTMYVGGQHPLLAGTRPGWYFEPGMHGGTLNDIGIHALDFIPWMTGLDWAGVPVGRSWNGKAKFAPHFHDCAQMMGRLSNGAGVLGDFSYLAPDQLGYRLPYYWKVVVHGTKGMAETHLNATQIQCVMDDASTPEILDVLPATPRAYLDDFLSEMIGNRVDLTTADALRASRLALEVQARAVS